MTVSQGKFKKDPLERKVWLYALHVRLLYGGRFRLKRENHPQEGARARIPVQQLCRSTREDGRQRRGRRMDTQCAFWYHWHTRSSTPRPNRRIYFSGKSRVHRLGLFIHSLPLLSPKERQSGVRGVRRLLIPQPRPFLSSSLNFSRRSMGPPARGQRRPCPVSPERRKVLFKDKVQAGKKRV